MHNKLQEILQVKQLEVEQLKTKIKDYAMHFVEQKSLKKALAVGGLSIIGEIKRKSPSKGHLAEIINVNELAEQYITAGVSALSVLTDNQFFAGSMADLYDVTKFANIPVLRKDFIIDEIQMIEAKQAGADAILLIVAALGNKTAELFEKAKRFNLDVIVEVHDQSELDFAIEIGAEIIGVNNRNLTTFEVDLMTSASLVKQIPDHIVKVSESGMRHLDDIKAIYNMGFDAVLIGEALVTTENPGELIQKVRMLSCQK